MLLYTEIVEKHLQNYQKSSGIGVVDGEFGLSLLLAYLYCYNKDERYLSKFYSLLDSIPENNFHNCTFGYGWGGLAWIILKIKKLDLLEDVDEWLQNLEQEIVKEFHQMIDNNNDDYFEGASGLIFYYLEKESIQNEDIKLFEKYINNINLKINYNKWETEMYNPEKEQISRVINLGVPHGITGILLIVILIHQKEIINCEKIIRELINYLLGYEISNTKYDFNFPSKIVDGRKTASALSWCYGDLMIGYAILKSGILLKDDYYKNYAIEILEKTLKRKYLNNDHLILCHGYTSLSHVYEKIHKWTGETCFRNQAEIWKNESINFYRNNINKQNVYAFNKNPSIFWGFSGFFMSLITWEDENFENWINCLLI